MNLLNFLTNILNIIQGYTKWLVNRLMKNTSERTKQRLRICVNCENNNHGICKLCGCIIKAKVRVNYPLDNNNKSIDGCPLQLW